MTQGKMMQQTAMNLCRLLGEYGIKATIDKPIRTVSKTLRHCWYVPRMMQMGFTNCVYVNLPEGMGFFIVTDTCEVVTASNVMILDAIECVLMEITDKENPWEYLWRCKWRFMQEYEDSERGIIAIELSQLRRLFNLATN